MQLHVGIHTGPVVAGHFGGAAGAAYAVTGDTVNTTARLLSAAEAGTILVSEATQALARHRFAFEPAGELALRGRRSPSGFAGVGKFPSPEEILAAARALKS